MENLHINEVLKIEDANIIDVREVVEFERGTIPGAKNIPMIGLMMNSKKFLNQDDKYYIMCQAGSRSQEVCNLLDAQGFDVVNVTGGYSELNQ